MTDLRDRIKISSERLEEINAFLTDPNNELINQLLEVVHRYGGPEEINRKAQEAGTFENLTERLRQIDSPYVQDIEWLVEQKEKNAFVSMQEYYDRVLGDPTAMKKLNQENRVTLEISALQYFPC